MGDPLQVVFNYQEMAGFNHSANGQNVLHIECSYFTDEPVRDTCREQPLCTIRSSNKATDDICLLFGRRSLAIHGWKVFVHILHQAI